MQQECRQPKRRDNVSRLAPRAPWFLTRSSVARRGQTARKQQTRRKLLASKRTANGARVGRVGRCGGARADDGPTNSPTSIAPLVVNPSTWGARPRRSILDQRAFPRGLRWKQKGLNPKPWPARRGVVAGRRRDALPSRVPRAPRAPQVERKSARATHRLKNRRGAAWIQQSAAGVGCPALRASFGRARSGSRGIRRARARKRGGARARTRGRTDETSQSAMARLGSRADEPGGARETSNTFTAVPNKRGCVWP